MKALIIFVAVLIFSAPARADYFCKYLAQEGGQPITWTEVGGNAVITIHREVLDGSDEKRVYFFAIYKVINGGTPQFTGVRIRAQPGTAVDTYIWTDTNHTPATDTYEVRPESSASHTHDSSCA